MTTQQPTSNPSAAQQHSTDAALANNSCGTPWRTPVIKQTPIGDLTQQNPVDGPLGDSSYAPGTGTS